MGSGHSNRERYVASRARLEKRLLRHCTAVLLIVRILYKMEVGSGTPERIAFALGECSHGTHSIDIMDADFFDETLLVIAFRSQGDGMTLR